MKHARKIIGSIIGLGIVLRLAQYLANRSLRLDEVFLTLNILNRSYGGLLQPLDDNQGAPVGFLFVEKLLTHLGGESEYVLRLFPLVGGILALVLFYKMAGHFVAPSATLLAVGLFALSDRLIFYASDVKQYSTDVTIALGIYAFAGDLQASPDTRSKIALLAGGGALAVWFSHAAVFMLAGVGGCLLWFRIRTKDWRATALLLGGISVWAASFAGCYVLNLAQSGQNQELMRFWEGYFMPLPPTSFADLLWFPRMAFELIAFILGFSSSKLVGLNAPELFRLSFAELAGLSFSSLAGLGLIILATTATAIALLAGCLSLFCKSKARWGLLVAPLGLTLLASGLHKYPFGERLILFLLPGLLLLIAAGLQTIKDQTAGYSIVIGYLFIGLVFCYPVISAAYAVIQPRLEDEARAVIAYVSQHRQASDVIYVDPFVEKALQYYGKRYGWQPTDYRALPNPLLGGAGVGHAQRTWFLFAHVKHRRQEIDRFREALDRVGTRRDAFTIYQPGKKPDGSEAYLYDLSVQGTGKAEK